MKTTPVLALLALAAGPALAQPAGLPPGDCYPPAAVAPPPTAALPAPAIAEPPTLPPVVVVKPAPSPVRPMMSDDAKFATLDTSGNGALDRGEVSANSELVTRFGSLDKNHDGKLSRMEYGLRNVDPAGGR
ncbi:hypothetical protein C3942_17405 [Solimonas fluminis]|uniref:EF-hand domain-containing protein n=1 Tax=Solimonas fluminis TaxID=2086571 RepID=A0A2S5TC73_9GAMM|nr:EF-hand domain-containing protein [Solimonas fluminis]PPE72556.1 hypothetical protein C3942_17405 [Solimonas fluminis]